MEYSSDLTALSNTTKSDITTSSTSSPSPPIVVLSPCAACKILRRRCADTCMLAPYFPPTDPVKFTTAHRVFGASNIIKLLQDIPESQRPDTVNSLVYEADARLRNPVYGCAGSVCQLTKQVNELKVQLARTQAEFMNLQAQYMNLLKLAYLEMKQFSASSQSLFVNGVNNGVMLRDYQEQENGEVFCEFHPINYWMNDLHGMVYDANLGLGVDCAITRS